MAEFIVGLAILADKGSMLIKMFTFFECSSVSILYVLNCCFKEVHIFKPATSKEGNSEVYVIGIGFKKHAISQEIIEKMICNFKSDKNMLQLDIIPKKFQEQVVEAARLFMNHQVSVIEGNIRSFRKFDKYENDRIKAMKYQLVEEYVKLYKLTPIREDQKILHGMQVNNDINLNVRVHSGSHSERMIFFHLSRRDQYQVNRFQAEVFLKFSSLWNIPQVFFDRLKQFYDSIFENDLNSSCAALKLSNTSLIPNGFINLIYGRPIEKVVSSKFILVTLVKFLNEIRSYLADTGEDFNGKRVNIVGNQLTIDPEFFRRTSYEVYEKEVVKNLLNFLFNGDSECLIVDGLPLFTQFMVGVVLFLSLFVFQEVHFKRSSGTISFKASMPKGKENLEILIKILENSQSTVAILGITNTKSLFTHSQDFYKSVIDYNNHLCLKFCSFYLNISNNL